MQKVMLMIKTIIAATVLFGTSTQLAAEELFAGADKEASRFDFLKGDWDCQWFQGKANGQFDKPMNCQWIGYYTFGNRMFQDDFTMFDDEGNAVFSGTTLRTYVPAKKQWDLTFLASQSGHWQQDQMLLTQQGEDAKGSFIGKIYFHQISKNAFSWRNERSYDKGKSWTLDSKIEARRRLTKN